MVRLIVAAVALTLPGAASAQDAAQEGPPERVRSVVLYGDQKCPEPTEEGEVVVCAQGDDSPYRIPSELRTSVERPDAVSWGVRVNDVMDFANQTIPNSCSPIGSGGQSGCTSQMLRNWTAERAAQRRRDATIP